MQNILLVIGLVFTYGIFSFVSGLRRNIAIAKATNLPYVIVPCKMLARHWLVLAPLYAKLIRHLPTSWWDDWLDLMLPDAAFRLDFKRYTRHGDTFVMVSPGAIMIQTSNADVIRQVITQRDKFPKPCQIYEMLKIFGENVVTTDGMVWKAHRKATSASFNEKNSALVFREIIEQTNGMISTWVDNLGNRSEPLTTISADITRLTINVISYVGFGLRLLWPGQVLPPGSDPAAAKYASLDAPPGYSLSFVDTLVRLMNDILLVLLFPHWLLKLSPWKGPRLAAAAHEDYIKYSNEMMNEKIAAVENGTRVEEGMDFMGGLVRGTYGAAAKNTTEPTEKISKAPALTRDEILGNAFIMFVAGHETSANTIHFTLINLATNPTAQRLIQKDIDELVGDSDPSTWDYEKLIGPMTSSAIAACMNETLRVIPPGPAIPKQVSPDRDQVVYVDGQECLLPKGSMIMIQAMKAHEDPRHWPYEESKLTPSSDDLRDYKPERWFETVPGPRNQNLINGVTERSESPETNDDESDEGIDRKLDRGVRFFRPRRGAYLPFSDGARSCLGRRVAQVEIMTFLAVLLQRYSVELAPDQWASEDEVQRMGRDARADVYRKSQASSRQTLAGAESVITLGLQGKTVPMRLVKRGEEKFVNWMSDA